MGSLSNQGPVLSHQYIVRHPDKKDPDPILELPILSGYIWVHGASGLKTSTL